LVCPVLQALPLNTFAYVFPRASLRLGQATWITLTGLPVYLINSIPRHAQPRLGLVDLIGFSIWASGFMLEVTADRQKSAWRERKNEKKHDEAFVKDGVWSWSRHPK
jgi:steroid 5-alpha reductase family enzyme